MEDADVSFGGSSGKLLEAPFERVVMAAHLLLVVVVPVYRTTICKKE